MSGPSVVLVHKVPASWEVNAKKNLNQSIKLSNKIENLDSLSEDELNLLHNLESDIFFLLANSISEYLGISNIHVILGHNSDEKRNWEVISRNGRIQYGEKFNFWSTNSPEVFPKINNVKVLLVRGNYPIFHNELISKYSPATTIFYPATSLFFPNLSVRLSNLIPKALKGEISENILSEMISDFSKFSSFSKIKVPKLVDKPTKLDIIEFRKLYRNYFQSVIHQVIKIREKESKGKYPIVLFDEELNLPALKKIYPNSRLLKFNKAASPIFNFDLFSDRDIDVIFTGTTIQRTKNFELFYELVDQIISINPRIKFAIVGVDEKIQSLKKRWSSENVEIYGRVSKSELCKLFNRSKNHLITSGRDCFPRTIPESIVCGCFLLALDILSDGTSIIYNNPLIGKIIDTTEESIIVSASNSVSLKIRGDKLSRDITEQLLIERNHLLISTLGKSLFSVENMIQLDLIWQEIDLNYENLN